MTFLGRWDSWFLVRRPYHGSQIEVEKLAPTVWPVAIVTKV
jgi:hypothetical protein